MKKNLFLMIAVLAASPVMGQDAKQIADSLSIPPVKAGAKQLPMPSVSGAQIKLLGADYEQLVNSKGKIAPVISDTPVNVSFKVTANGKTDTVNSFEKDEKLGYYYFDYANLNATQLDSEVKFESFVNETGVGDMVRMISQTAFRNGVAS